LGNTGSFKELSIAAYNISGISLVDLIRMKTFEIVIETPKESRQKYKYDKKSGSFKLSKLLPLGMCFPYDFGFLPGTEAEDGDPIDAMIISEFISFPGCRIDGRLIGVLTATQDKKGEAIRNDRYFFIPENSVAFKLIHNIKDFPAEHLKQLLFFFITYNAEKNRKFNPLKVHNAVKAGKLLSAAVEK
jgi:inorganic pyrophosphatase